MTARPSTKKSPKVISGSSAAELGQHASPKQSGYRYKIGLIGSRASGKTCLLVALFMARRANPRGYNAAMFPLKDPDNQENKFAMAVKELREGNWPEPTRPEDHHLVGRFTDGKMLEKYVELFDYSGDLVNPTAADGPNAKRLRARLRKMDGLLVLAEHPILTSETFELSKELSGLMQVISLLRGEGSDNPSADKRTVPIAMLVTKWDRSPHFDPSLDADGQECVLNEKFLNAKPEPYHRAVANVLRPASDNRFKAFPVSAITPLRRVKGVEKELPPVHVPLQSVGLEDPFIWVIEQRDELDAAELRQSLEGTTILTPPWTAFRNVRVATRLKRRFKAAAPEGVRIGPLYRKAWRQFVAQTSLSLILILCCLALIETPWDFKQHHIAVSQANDPSGNWQEGAKWFRDFGRSSVTRHFVYSRVVLSKQAAQQQALKIEKEKDDAFFEMLNKGFNDDKLDESEKLANEQNLVFPNSPHRQQRDQILVRIVGKRIETTFQKVLSQWNERFEPLRPSDHDGLADLERKLRDLNGLADEIRKYDKVPLTGVIRDPYLKILTNCDDLRKDLAKKIADKRIREGWVRDYRQAIDAGEYAKAARLFTDDRFQKVPDGADHLRKFQANLKGWIASRCDTLSHQGENWEEAVKYAEQFTALDIRAVITERTRNDIQSIIQGLKKKGDVFFYNLVKTNQDTPSINNYLEKAPIQSMASEVTSYRKWLQDRQVPKTLTFRLLKIVWGPDLERGWLDESVIKFYVKGCGDTRNEQPDKNDRTGFTYDSNGYRVATVNGISQVQDVDLSFQLYDVPKVPIWWSQNWTLRQKCDRQITAESLAAAGGKVIDRGGTMLEIAIEGMVPKPSLPLEWHPVQ